MAEVFDFGLQQHKIKMDGKFFENNLFAVAGDTGRRLEVQLLDSDNLVQNTTGISLRLNANVAGQATYAEATLVDATKGLYELDLPNGMLIAPGNWQFQWQIIGTSGEKLHSFAFMGSIGSNLSEGGSQATNFYLNLEDLKAMQEDLVNGTFDSEVLETNIAEKLTNLETQYAPKLTEVTAQLAQTKLYNGQADFVELIRNRTNYKVLSVKKIDTPYEALQVFCHDGNQHITHEWKKNTNDDFWKYNVAFGGKLTTSPDYLKSTTSKSGTWSTIDGSGNVYTTQIGATFMVQINGSTLQLNHMTDNRGGMFKLIIDGDEGNPILLSCYSDSILIKNTIVATGLLNKQHTIVGTFLGNDPDHAPTATARGWIRDDQTNPNSTDRYTMVGGIPFNGAYSSSVNKMLLGYGSNKEFAFNMTKNGQTHWFPEHNNQGTAFKTSEPILTVNNKEIEFSNMEIGKTYDGVSMSFSQRLKCIFPTITDPLATMVISYDVGLDGVLAITGKLEFKQDVLVNNGYSLMMPFAYTTNNYILNELVTGIGTSHKSTGDDSNTNFLNESDQTFSFCSVSSVNPDDIAAMTIDFPNKTYRYNQQDRGFPFVFLQNRSSYPKLYPLVMFNHEAVDGEIYQFYGRFAVGKIKNIYDLIR